MNVRDFIEVARLEQDDLTPTTYRIELVSIVDDVDPDELRRIPAREFKLRYEEAVKKTNLTGKPIDSISIDGADLFLKPFSELTLGEYIDLEAYLINAEVGNTLSVLYRKRFGGGLDRHTFEPYSNVDVKYRSEKFLDRDADGLVQCVLEYRKFRDEIITTYSSLFDSGEEQVVDADEDDLTESEIKMRQAADNHKQFSWEAFCLFLAYDDVTKLNEVTDLPMFLAFNIASYKKSVTRKTN
jgi:hypothetical protein